MIRCGWCGWPTPEGPRCSGCGRDPQLAWRQRGETAPVLARHDAGRPELDATEVRAAYLGACEALTARGRTLTVEAIAEYLDRSPRTVREWRKRFGLP